MLGKYSFTIPVMVPAIRGDLLLLGPIVADRSRSLPIVTGRWACVCTGACRCAGMRVQSLFEIQILNILHLISHDNTRVLTKQKIQELCRCLIVHDCQLGPSTKIVSRCEFLTRI